MYKPFSDEFYAQIVWLQQTTVKKKKRVDGPLKIKNITQKLIQH
jgi:hypothetical protein